MTNGWRLTSSWLILPRHLNMKLVPKIGIVSLGCPKALVDSERILTRLRAEGYEISPTYQDANLVLVNTCGFLDSARAESLEAIGEALAENGRVIVTGCLGTDRQVILEKYPDVLAVTGPHQYEEVVDAVHTALPPVHDPFFDLLPPAGIKLTPRHYAYLKISEGCNNSCSFCIIPHLRGRLNSRPLAHVLQEAEKLAAAGVKELLVISQDTSAYGSDVRYAASEWRGKSFETRFQDLARALNELGIWVRLHYVYPYPHVDGVVSLMSQGRILPYLDIPFQHASAPVLKAMRRPAAAEKTLSRIARWREICPEIVIRSTFIVGFPGESDDDFEVLINWLKEAELDRVGCFKYENVEGATARALPGHVPETIKEERWNRLMQTQQVISARKLKNRLGQTLDVLIDTVDNGQTIGRSYADAPEIDGVVHITSPLTLHTGDNVKVKITGSSEYDLTGVALNG